VVGSMSEDCLLWLSVNHLCWFNLWVFVLGNCVVAAAIHNCRWLLQLPVAFFWGFAWESWLVWQNLSANSSGCFGSLVCTGMLAQLYVKQGLEGLLRACTRSDWILLENALLILGWWLWRAVISFYSLFKNLATRRCNWVSKKWSNHN